MSKEKKSNKEVKKPKASKVDKKPKQDSHKNNEPIIRLFEKP